MAKMRQRNEEEIHALRRENEEMREIALLHQPLIVVIKTKTLPTRSNQEYCGE